MVRGGKKKDSAATAAAAAAAAPNPEAEERSRLKDLAFAKRILSQNPPKVGPATALAPSTMLIKHHSKDIILKKSQRKNKFLFSFPGLLGSISGGKIGELKDLGTKNPILYLDFPQGQMKLFGTVTYPNNRYLTMQFSQGGKNVTCDNYFENLIVFSDAWWIGTKDENPEELRLPFPQEMKPQDKPVKYDFKGGVGVKCDRIPTSGKKSTKCSVESPEPDLEDDSTDVPSDLKETGVAPNRPSSRTAQKTFNFAEGSSGADLTGNVAEISEEEDDKVDIITGDTENKSFSTVKFVNDNQDPGKGEPASGKNKWGRKSKDDSSTKPTSLVQATLSSLFKKAEKNPSKSAKLGNDVEVQGSGTEMEEQKSLKRMELDNSDALGQRKPKRKAKADSVSTSQSSDLVDSSQADDDDIEEFSSSSEEDMDESDEDWTSQH